MKLRRPEDQLEYIIVNASRLVIKKYNAHFKQFGLSQTQITALVQLERAGPINQSELAKSIGLGKAAMGTLLEGFEASGLIIRIRDEQDQRAIKVQLTEEGRRLTHQVDEIAADLGQVLRAGISTEERRAFIKTLRRLLENLKTMS